MRKNVVNSPRLLELKKRQQRVFLNKILLSLFVFLVIFAGLAYISRVPSLNINEVEIIGNKVIDTETIKEAVEQVIKGKYLWFFPKTNILFYPKNAIKNKLNNQFTRLGNISFFIKDEKILEVSVTERVALYLWCGETLPEINNYDQKCYFLDKDGYIFDEAPYFSGEVYFKFYGKLPPDFTKLILFKETLESIGLKPVTLFVQDNGDIKIFLSAETQPTGPEIIFKIDSDFQKVIENLEAALKTEPLQSNFKNKYSSLMYIDLRFGNKVYFKFR